MGFLSVIRRWALRDKMPIREIARRTGLSRNTIKKYLREDAVEPRFNTPRRPSKLDPYADRLSAWLLAQTRKSRKERRNVKLMYEDLVKLGYDGSYERVAAFARAWRADRHRAEQTTGRGTFVPLVFQPGEAFQFDWSEDWATIGGERIKLQVAHSNGLERINIIRKIKGGCHACELSKSEVTRPCKTRSESFCRSRRAGLQGGHTTPVEARK
ncbi:transcriptional regulator with XRE-family HTH domain [Sulfitobacter undariae]|uniref:Transcriptional regulator with XRE-family HTH domain n=1 Tax=Sulfitobacter undariae TaxID=1563671 RepID=A0A7W6E6N6_9RHOB|nr:transcriptional regulator with XRE-family HTH domain [Sulfitobacter undariae]